MAPKDVKFMPEEWITGDINTFGNDMYSYRAVFCLEHLIKNNYNGKSVNVVELGPMPTFEIIKHKAPIRVLKERNPNINCISIGSRKVSGERKNEILGDIHYVNGLVSTEDSVNAYIEELIHKLGGIPDIFYGKQIFENSETFHESLPVGPYKPFEKCAEVLEDGGFIVVDNAGATKGHIGIANHWEESKKMELSHSYIHTVENSTNVVNQLNGSPIEKGIYVFRKVSQ